MVTMYHWIASQSWEVGAWAGQVLPMILNYAVKVHFVSERLISH